MLSIRIAAGRLHTLAEQNLILLMLWFSKCPSKHTGALQAPSIIMCSSLGSPQLFITIFEGFCLEWSLYSKGTTELEWEAGFLLIVR